MIYLTRKVGFCASHRLYNPALTDEENVKIFGKCSNPGGHGHNYELEITIRGDLDPKSGMLINIKELKEIVEREVVSQLDHIHLNTDSRLLKGMIPTSENLLVRIWDVLERKIPRGELFELKLHETDNNTFTYRGEKIAGAHLEKEKSDAKCHVNR